MNNIKSSSGQILFPRLQDPQQLIQESEKYEAQEEWTQAADRAQTGHHKVNSMPGSSQSGAQQLQGQRIAGNHKGAQQLLQPQPQFQPQILKQQPGVSAQKPGHSRGNNSQNVPQQLHQQPQSRQSTAGQPQKHVLIAQGAQNLGTTTGYGGDGLAGQVQGAVEQPTRSVKASQRQGQKAGSLMQVVSKGAGQVPAGGGGIVGPQAQPQIQAPGSGGNAKKKAKVVLIKNSGAGSQTHAISPQPQQPAQLMVPGALGVGQAPSQQIAASTQPSIITGQPVDASVGVRTTTNQLGGSSHIVMNQQQHVKMRQAAKYAYGGGPAASGTKGHLVQSQAVGQQDPAAAHGQAQPGRSAMRMSVQDDTSQRRSETAGGPANAAHGAGYGGYAPSTQLLSPAHNFGQYAAGKPAKEASAAHGFAPLMPPHHKKSNSLMNQKMMQLLLTQDPPSHCGNTNDFNNSNKEQISAQILKSQQIGSKPNTFSIDSTMIKTVDEARKKQHKQPSLPQNQVPQAQLQHQPAHLYHHFKSKSLVQPSDFVIPSSTDNSSIKPSKKGQPNSTYLLTQAQSHPKVLHPKGQKSISKGQTIPLQDGTPVATGGPQGLVVRMGQPTQTKEAVGPGAGSIVKIKGKHISSSFDNTAGGAKHSLQGKSTAAQDVQVRDCPFSKMQQRQPGKQQSSVNSAAQGQHVQGGKVVGGKVQPPGGGVAGVTTGGGNVALEEHDGMMEDAIGVVAGAQALLAGGPILLAHGGGMTGPISKSQKKASYKAKQAFGHGTGAHVRTAGIPSGAQSALVTQGNVTHVPVTGAQTNMKQSFSDLNLVLEDPAQQAADDEMDVASDGMQGSVHLHSVHNHQVVAGGGGLLSGVRQPQHLRTKSDANYIQQLHAQNNKNTFIISSANHVYQSKKAANLKAMTSNNQVSSQGATKGLLKFNQQKQSSILSQGKSVIQKNLAAAAMQHPHGQKIHGQTQQPRAVPKQQSTGLKKLGPQGNKGAFSAAQVGPGAGPQQVAHSKKNQSSMASSASHYKNPLSSQVAPKAAIASNAQASNAAHALKPSQRPVGYKKGLKQQRKQAQHSEAAYHAQGEEPSTTGLDLDAFSGNQNKTTEQKYAELQLRFNDLTQKYVALAAQKTEDRGLYREGQVPKDPKRASQHSQSYYGQLEGHLLRQDQVMQLHASTFQPAVHPQTVQQTLEPPQIMMIDPDSSTHGVGPAHHSRGPSMGPRQANLCHSGSASCRNQGCLNYVQHQQKHFADDDLDPHSSLAQHALPHGSAVPVDEGDVISSGMATAERHKPVFVQNFEINDRRVNLHFGNDGTDPQELVDDMDDYEAVRSGEYVQMECQEDEEAAETELARIIASQNVSYNVTPGESRHASMEKKEVGGYQRMVHGAVECGPVSHNASLANLVKGGRSVDQDGQDESQVDDAVDQENAVLDLAALVSQGGSPTIPGQGLSRMEALAVPGEFLPSARRKKNYNLTEELAQPNNTLQKMQHHARAGMKKNAGTHHSGISRLSSGSGGGLGRPVAKGSATMSCHKRSVSDGGIFNNVGLKAKAMQVAAKNNNQSFFQEVNGAAQSSNRGSILQPYNGNYSGTHSGHQPSVQPKEHGRLENTFEQRIHEMRLQNGLNVSSASSQGTAAGQSSNGGSKAQPTQNVQRHAAGRYHQGPQMMIVEEGDDEQQERTATQNTQQSQTSHQLAGAGQPILTREDEENIQTEIGQEHHTTEHHDLRVKPSGSQSNLMQIVKNQRLAAEARRLLGEQGRQVQGPVAGEMKAAKRKQSIHFGLEAGGVGIPINQQIQMARTPNVAQKGPQRPQPLQEPRNHSSSSKHLKSVQNKKIVARKGPVLTQTSSQHPNKPNQTRIARRSRERGEAVRLPDESDPTSQLQAPPASSTPDMDINKIAKRYKKLRKAGEHQGGRTVIEMSSYAAGPEIEDLAGEGEHLLRHPRPQREQMSMQGDKKGPQPAQAPTPQGQGRLAVGEILQLPLKLKGQHRRVKSNAADHSAAVVGLSQVSMPSHYKGAQGPLNAKKAPPTLASTKASAHNHQHAIYARKLAGGGAARNSGQRDMTKRAQHGNPEAASRSSQASLLGSRRSLPQAEQQEDGESRGSWRQSREESRHLMNYNEGPMMIYQDQQQNEIDMNLLSECLPGDGTVDDSVVAQAHRRGIELGGVQVETGEFGEGAALFPDGHSRKVINVSFNDYNLSMSNEYEDSFPPENSCSRRRSPVSSLDNSPTPATASAANNNNVLNLLLSNNQNASNQKLNNFLEALQMIKPQNPVAKQPIQRGVAGGVAAGGHPNRAKEGNQKQGGIVVMDQVKTATGAKGKGPGAANSISGPAMSGISDKMRVEKYQKMMQKHQMSSEGPSITTVQHQRLKSANDGGIMKPGQVREKRNAIHSMDRQVADGHARVPKQMHKAGHSEIPPSIGVSLGIPASTTGLDSAKNFKISFVGDQALLRQQQRKTSKHKASKSNAVVLQKSPAGSNNLASLVPSKQSFHNKVQFHVPVSTSGAGKPHHFPAPLSSLSGTGSNTAAQPSPIISTKRVPQKILDATITGSISPKRGAEQRMDEGDQRKRGEKANSRARGGGDGEIAEGIRMISEVGREELRIEEAEIMEGQRRQRQGAVSSKGRREVQWNNFMSGQESSYDQQLPDQNLQADRWNQNDFGKTSDPKTNIDLDDTIEESAHLQFNLNQPNPVSQASNSHQRLQGQHYQKKSLKPKQPTQSQKPRVRCPARRSQGPAPLATQNSQEVIDRAQKNQQNDQVFAPAQKSASSHHEISIVDEAELRCRNDEMAAPNTERRTLVVDESLDRLQMIHNLNKQDDSRIHVSDLTLEEGVDGDGLRENSIESDHQQQIRAIQQYPVPREHANGLPSEGAHNTPSQTLCAPQVSERLITEESNGASNLTPRARQIRKLIKLIKLSFRSTGRPPDTTIDFYRIGKILGKGAFGKVHLAVHKLSQCLCAVKSINKQFFSDESQTRKVMQEVVMLKKTRHKNIVRLYEYFETEKHILFVIEVCAGGDLLNYVRRRRRLKEEVAKCLFKQIIESLAYCHSKSILHRDIKLDNILLDAKGQVKLCDFGVGKIVKKGEKMTEQCGTPAYIAPEILRDQGYYGFAVDIWSSGVVLFAMLYGTVPFKANNMSELQQIIMKADYKLKDDISADARDLLKGLLDPNPESRLGVGEVLSHSWMRDVPDSGEVELFTEQEKQYIKTEFTYGKSTRLGRNGLGLGLMGPETGFQDQLHNSDGETLQSRDLFTEHQLDSTQNSILKNCETKSIILAPFNSTKSNLDQNGNCQNMPLSDSVKALIESKRIIKFGPRVRDIDKQYEINNNADMDNGQFHQCVVEGADAAGAPEGQPNEQDATDDLKAFEAEANEEEALQVADGNNDGEVNRNDTQKFKEGQADSDAKMINFLENNQEDVELDEEEQEILQELKKQGQKKQTHGNQAKQSELQRLEDMIQDQEKQERMTLNENEEPYADTSQGPGQMVVGNAAKFIQAYATPEYDAGGGNVVTENSNHQFEIENYNQCYSNISMEDFFKKESSRQDPRHMDAQQQNISIDIQGQSSPELPKASEETNNHQMKIVECATEGTPMTSPKRPSGSVSPAKVSNRHSDQVMLSLLQKFHSEEQIELNHRIIDKVEEFGYPRDYIVKSIKNHDLNSASTTYLLLHFKHRTRASRPSLPAPISISPSPLPSLH